MQSLRRKSRRRLWHRDCRFRHAALITLLDIDLEH
jgi:hypothetical protein